MYFLCRLCKRNFIRLIKDNATSRNYSETFDGYHVYDRILLWKSNRHLADYLCENIIYDKNGIIALNKPYGVSFSKTGLNWQNVEERKKTFKPVVMHRTLKVADPDEVSETNSGFLREDNINLLAALPHIQDYINDGKDLRIVRVPEKYTSGVSLLARDERTELRMRKCIDRIKAEKLACDTYLAIVNGKPLMTNIRDLRIGIKLEESANKKHKKATLTKTWSKNDVLKSKVKLATVNSKLLSVGEEELASLMQVETNMKRWHFLRLFLATQLLAPALGDHMFGSRVKKVMGEVMLIDKWNPAAVTGQQKLDIRLLNEIGLENGSENYIPTMIHHSAVTLPGFFKRNDNPLRIEGKPPDHFVWTAFRLGLSMPQQNAHRPDKSARRMQMKASM